MKACIKCEVVKPLREFALHSKTTDGHHSICKECKGKYETLRRQRIREFLAEIRSRSVCEMCDESHPATLQFHHIDPKEKDASIAQMLARRWSLKRIQQEIDKCRVLCANCHFKLHWQERRYTIA